MQTIEISGDELRTRTLRASSVDAAASAIHADGCVVLIGAVDVAALAALREAFESIAAGLLAGARASSRKRNFQAPLPLDPALIHGDLVANDFVAQLTAAVLGAGAYCNLYSADVNCPCSDAQPLHVDAGQLWPRLLAAHPPATLMINVPLVETGVENGSTELWPGTHHDTRFGMLVPQRAEEARRAEVPPVRANLRPGSVLIRDARLWHRGTPNQSAAVRPVITMQHNIHWLERGPRMEVPAACKDAFVSAALAAHIRVAPTAHAAN